MKKPFSSAFLIMSAITIAFSPSLLRADTWTWDAVPNDGTVTGGAGTWDTLLTNWTNDGGTSDTAWNNAGTENAVFSGTGGQITVAENILANSITLGSGYTLYLNTKGVTDATALSLDTGTKLGFYGNSSTSVYTGDINLNGGVIYTGSGNGAVIKGLFTGSGDLLMDYAAVSFANILTQSATTLNNTYTGNTTLTNNVLTFTGYGASNFNPFGATAGATVSLTASSGSGGYGGAGVVFTGGTATNSTFNVGQNFAFSASGGKQAYIQNNDGVLHLQGNVSIATDGNAASSVNFITQYNGKDIYLEGVVSGAGAMIVSDAGGSYGMGAVHLTNAANTYSGTITVSDRNGAWGILTIDNATAAQYATVNLAGTTYGGRLNINADNVVVAGLNGTGTPGTTAAVFTTSATIRSFTVNNATDNVFNGVIGVAGTYAWNASTITPNATNLALVKSGVGTLTLSGANAYVGGTTINAGTLATGNISALGTGAVAVSGGTLAVGATNLSGIASLAVNTGTLDTTAGAITTTGAFTLAGGVWKIGDAADGVAAGSFAITGGVIDLTGFTNGAVNGTYSLIGGTGTASGYFFLGASGGHDYAINTSGDLVITTAVPEPGTYGLPGAGALAAIALARRRRKIVAA